MPANTYTLIEKIVVGAAGAANITFTNIPQTYTDLLVVSSCRSTTTDSAATVQFNGSTASRTTIGLYGNGSSATSYSGTSPLGSIINGSSQTASTFGNSSLYIPNYTSSNNKSSSMDGVNENNATGANQFFNANLWSNSAAITSITLTPEVGSFVQYSSAYLYGIAKEGVTPSPSSAPYATGGDRILFDGTYWYHVFTSTGTFTPQKGLSADCLVIAGGGGGVRWYAGGGGGAGGLVYNASTSLASGTAYTVTVGAGGAGTNSDTLAGNNGTNSNITGGSLSLTAAVGGGGASAQGGATTTGGSAGGGTFGTGPGAKTAGQGNDGGTAYSAGGNFNSKSGGGGGAGGAGGNASSSAAGAGGVGSSAYSSWGSATNTGQLSGGTYYYAGGGGGGNYNGTAGAGGLGGGGSGGGLTPSYFGASGTANTGGGGGGSQEQVGGNGGSGIVIVRYAA